MVAHAPFPTGGEIVAVPVFSLNAKNGRKGKMRDTTRRDHKGELFSTDPSRSRLVWPRRTCCSVLHRHAAVVMEADGDVVEQPVMKHERLVMHAHRGAAARQGETHL